MNRCLVCDEWQDICFCVEVPEEHLKPEYRATPIGGTDQKCSEITVLEKTPNLEVDNRTPRDQFEGMHVIKHPRLNRALGSLFGAACGDALGATREFTYPSDLPPFPENATDMKDIVGGGTFKVDPGQVTDDTQMAIALARAITYCRDNEAGKFNPAVVMDEYQFWGQFAFDKGIQTSKALYSGAKHPYPGYVMFQHGATSGAGNGCLMRATPIAVAFHNDPFNLLDWAIRDAMLTHGHPLAVISNVGYVTAIAFGINGGDMTEAPAAAREAMRFAAKELETFEYPYKSTDLQKALAQLETDLDKAQDEDPGLFSGELFRSYTPATVTPTAEQFKLALDTGNWDALFPPTTETKPYKRSEEPDIWNTKGFCRTAFRYAFWHLANYMYDEAVIDAASRGGDSDTNAAIVGGLLGAFEGIESISEAWLDAVHKCRPGGDSIVFQDHTAPCWDDYYHPNMFRTFAYDSLF